MAFHFPSDGVGVLDNFNQALAYWDEPFGGITRYDDEAGATASGTNLVSWNNLTVDSDCEIFDTITTLPSTGEIHSLLLRFNTTTFNGYICQYTVESGVDIIEYTNGTPTKVGSSISQEFSAGDKFGFRAEGSNLTLWRDSGTGWTLVATRTDSTHTTAYDLVLGWDEDTCRIDDFGGGDYLETTVVAPTTDELTLTEYSVTLLYDVDINATTDALSLVEYQATIDVSSDTDVAVTLDELTLTEYSTGIIYDVDVVSTTDSLTLTEYLASVVYGVGVIATVDPLTLTEHSASIEYDVGITATTDPLTLTEYQVTVANDTTVTATTDNLTLTTYLAAVTKDIIVNTITDLLVLTEYPTTVTYDVGVVTGSDSLIITEHQAVVDLDQLVEATTASLVLTEYQATLIYDVNVLVTTDTLILTEHLATVLSAITEIDGVFKYWSEDGNWVAVNFKPC